MTLEEFLASPVRNTWIEEPGINVYVRRSIERFDVANIIIAPELRRQGVFKVWLAKVERLAPAKCVLIENVHNEVLMPFLERMGYVPHHWPHCWVKFL